jgi:hypothetical protein
MSMRPHWLDEVFDKGKGDPEAIAKALAQHPKVQGALDAAAYTYRQAERAAKELAEETEGTKVLPGGDPKQNARSAFLEHAELDVTFPAGDA